MPDLTGPWEPLFKPIEPLLFLVLRAALVYLFMVVAMRLAGKREIGQLTPFDLVLILLVANAIQNAMIGVDTSVTAGIISVSVLYALNYFFGRLQARNGFFRKLVVGNPVLLVHDGEVLEDHLKREHLNREDLLEQMREHGIPSLDRVAEAILEPDGNLSFITRTAEGYYTRKKRTGPAGERSGGTTRAGA